MDNRLEAFGRLLKIMDELRAQCPWDKKQTIQSLRNLTLEEVYELSEGILSEDWANIKEELGDVLLHLVFYAKIASEEQRFDITEVIDALCNKLIYRHPHIYGDVIVKDEEEVKRNWEQLKIKEGKQSILEGVPKSLPSLVKALRIQEKVKQVGFDWEDKAVVLEKVEEEIQEVKQAIIEAEKDEIEEEIGDLLFSCVNLARHYAIDPDKALSLSNRKFMQRFQWIEAYAIQHQLVLQEISLESLDQLWIEAKTAFRK